MAVVGAVCIPGRIAREKDGWDPAPVVAAIVGEEQDPADSPRNERQWHPNVPHNALASRCSDPCGGQSVQSYCLALKLCFMVFLGGEKPVHLLLELVN